MESISRPYTAHEKKLLAEASQIIVPTKLPDAHSTPVETYNPVGAALQRTRSTVMSKIPVHRDV